jgi:hypothetical protein
MGRVNAGPIRGVIMGGNSPMGVIESDRRCRGSRRYVSRGGKAGVFLNTGPFIKSI